MASRLWVPPWEVVTQWGVWGLGRNVVPVVSSWTTRLRWSPPTLRESCPRVSTWPSERKGPSPAGGLRLYRGEPLGVGLLWVWERPRLLGSQKRPQGCRCLLLMSCTQPGSPARTQALGEQHTCLRGSKLVLWLPSTWGGLCLLGPLPEENHERVGAAARFGP